MPPSQHLGIWIIGDQVSRAASSLNGIPHTGTPICFIESKKFCERRPYHWQKLVLILSAMRHFAAEFRAAGHTVDYFTLADDFTSALKQFVAKHRLTLIRVMEPNDYLLTSMLPAVSKAIGCPIEITENNQFLTSHEQFQAWTAGKKSLTMEFFYREQRKRLNILMEPDGKTPVSEQWNLDHDNRNPLPANIKLPDRFTTPPDQITREVIADICTHFRDKTFGGTPDDMEQKFAWPVTPQAAHAALDYFLHHSLANFGPYEDAMTTRSNALFHSHLSIPLNCGLIHPREILTKTLAYALPRLNKEIPLSSLEGFIRQLIGWREFIRGIYWRESRRQAGKYDQMNTLNATHPLPNFYWTAETDMACMHHALQPVIDHSFTHHIPRLMVLSNFALLHGISPQALNEWFIYAFADGYDWVTTPNVIGMSTYADGGIVGSKPYAAGGAYINKMSNYCRGCKYDPKQSTGPTACPFTRAYWPFYAQHRDRFKNNPRVALTIRALEKMDPKEIAKRQQERDAWFTSLPQYT